MQPNSLNESDFDNFCPWYILPQENKRKAQKNDQNIKDLVRPGLWAHSNKIPEIKRRLRERVPVTHDYFVRRGNPDEQIINYLYHKGFEKSGQMIEKLLEEEERQVRTTSLREQLKSSKELLTELADTLKDVESGDQTIFTLVLLAQSLYDRAKSFEWMAHMIFDYALDLASNTARSDDDGYLEAKVRYPFGKFLIEIENFQKAVDVLEVVYSLTEKKAWYSFTPGRTLFSDTCDLLSTAHIQISERIKKQDLGSAMEHSKKGVKYALQAKNKYAVPPAYITHAKILMDTGNYETALDYLYKALQCAQAAQDIERICEANLVRGLCLHKMGENDHALLCVRRANIFAEKAKMIALNGECCLLLAYIHENMKQLAEAVTNYLQAETKFKQLGRLNSVLEARFRCGHAFANLIFGSYFELLQNITNPNTMRTALFALNMWKEKRVPFWDDTHDNYDELDIKEGFSDDFRVDAFLLKDTQLTYWTRLKSAIFPWGPPTTQPFSKGLFREFKNFRHLLYLDY